MRARVALGLVALVGVACGTSAVLSDAGPDGAAPADASSEDAPAPPADTGVKDAGLDARDCGRPDLSDAGACDPVSPCTADPAPDAAACWNILDGSCAQEYTQLVRCTRTYTVCDPATCRTDSIKTGVALQQSCANQQQIYQTCSM